MILLFTATDTGLAQVGSRLIRAFEGGLASHCGVLLQDGQVIDATLGKGVAKRSLADFLQGRRLVAQVHVPLPDEGAALRWLESKLGAKYDVLAIVSFLLWRDIGRKDRYECTGLVMQALLAGGFTARERTDRVGVRHLLLMTEGRA